MTNLLYLMQHNYNIYCINRQAAVFLVCDVDQGSMASLILNELT